MMELHGMMTKEVIREEDVMTFFQEILADHDDDDIRAKGSDYLAWLRIFFFQEMMSKLDGDKQREQDKIFWDAKYKEQDRTISNFRNIFLEIDIKMTQLSELVEKARFQATIKE